MKEKSEIEIFCDNILYLRQKNNLSHTNMAKKLHITIKTLKTLEKGIVPKTLSSNIIFYIHREFNVQPKNQFISLRKK